MNIIIDNDKLMNIIIDNDNELLVDNFTFEIADELAYASAERIEAEDTMDDEYIPVDDGSWVGR